MILSFLLDTSISFGHPIAAENSGGSSQCTDLLNVDWNPTEKYVWRVLCESDDIDFLARTFLSKHIDPKSDDWPDSRRISGEFVKQIISEKQYATYITDRSISINNVWIQGTIAINDVDRNISLTFTQSKIDAPILIFDSSIDRIDFKSSELNSFINVGRSVIHEGIFIAGSSVRGGISVADSNIQEFAVADTKIYPGSTMHYRGRDTKGRIFQRTFDKDSTSIFVRDSTLGRWVMTSVSTWDILVTNLNAENVFLSGLLRLDLVDLPGRPTVHFINLEITDGFRVRFVFDFEELRILNGSIGNNLVVNNSKLDELFVIDLEAHDVALSGNKILSVDITDVEVNDLFAVADNLEQIRELYSALAPSLLRKYEVKVVQSSIEKGQKLHISLAELGSLMLRKESVSELVLNSVDISQEVSFYLGEPNYDNVRLGAVRFERLAIANADRAVKDVEFLKKDAWPSMYEYIQFSRAYREAGLKSEAENIMIAGYDRMLKETGGVERAVKLGYKYLTGYGYKLEYSFFWVLGLVVVGWIVAAVYSRIEEREKRLGFWYSFDLFFPFIQLKQEHTVAVFTHHTPTYYFLIHQVIGFVLISYTIAGVVDIMVE